MIIDDETLNIIVLTDILSKDYKISVVSDSRNALKSVERNKPDVILLDIIMPEKDGYDVITELKNSEDADVRETPVIFITGINDSIAEEKGLVLGAVDYITKPFSSHIVKLRIRNQIKMLEQLREIERLSMHDQLTGLPNRRFFESRLNAEWGRAHREDSPISLLLIDVDKFKGYNDAYGHQQGDLALKAVAKVFADTLKRSTDLAARWGGEEFIVLLPNTDGNGAAEIAEQVRANMEKIEIPLLVNDENADIGAKHATVSVGVYTCVSGASITLNDFISKADTMLYKAKGEGRNCISVG